MHVAITNAWNQSPYRDERPINKESIKLPEPTEETIIFLTQPRKVKRKGNSEGEGKRPPKAHRGRIIGTIRKREMFPV